MARDADHHDAAGRGHLTLSFRVRLFPTPQGLLQGRESPLQGLDPVGELLAGVLLAARELGAGALAAAGELLARPLAAARDLVQELGGALAGQRGGSGPRRPPGDEERALDRRPQRLGDTPVTGCA
jgi:hypothetical protein